MSQNVLIMFLFFMKLLYLVTAKISSDINNFLYFSKVLQELGGSLQVRQNFWYLIIASTNWFSM